MTAAVDGLIVDQTCKWPQNMGFWSCETSLPRRFCQRGTAHGWLPNLRFCSAAASSAMFAFWRQLSSTLRYNHASIAKASLLLTSTTSAVVATRADTCRTSNSIMSSLSAIFSVPVTFTSLFMVLLLLHYGMLVVTSNTSRLYVWS